MNGFDDNVYSCSVYDLKKKNREYVLGCALGKGYYHTATTAQDKYVFIYQPAWCIIYSQIFLPVSTNRSTLYHTHTLQLVQP